MKHSRLDIVSGAKNCLLERVNCPRTCPLFYEQHCQRIIFREFIRMYDESKGRVSDDEEEPVCDENDP